MGRGRQAVSGEGVMRSINWLVCAGLVVLLSGTCGLLGQAPAASGPKKIYTNRTAFKLPLRVDERDRPRLQAVELYVVNGPGGSWAMKESVTPTHSEFIYKVDQDGEYWFTVVTVDKAGGRNPADLSQEPASLIVVVDRQPPEVKVRPFTSPF